MNKECLTGSEHRIEKQHPSICNVFWQLVVEQPGFGSLFIPLNEDLADTNRATAITKALLHCLARPHYGHPANPPLEANAGVGPTNRRGDCVLDNGQMIQALLHQEADDAVGVEDKVCSLRVLVANHPNAEQSEPSV